MRQVYIVIDIDAWDYQDIVLGVYEHAGDAEECMLTYECSVAIRDTSRFRVLQEAVH
jgi:hypothetical protein